MQQELMLIEAFDHETIRFFKYLLGGIFLLTTLFLWLQILDCSNRNTFVNNPEAQAADITLNNDIRHIKK